MADPLQLRVELETAKTQRDIENLRRQTTEFRKSQLLGSQEFQQAAKLEADIKNKLHTLNQQAYSDNAKIKESYFEVGNKLRGLKIAGVEAAQALGYQAGGLGAIFASMIGPAGLIGAVSGGVALLISHFNELRDAARSAAQAGLSAFMAGGRFTPGTLEAQRTKTQGSLNALAQKYGLIGPGARGGEYGAQLVMSSEDYQQRIALQAVLKMLDDEIAKEHALNIIKGMNLQIEKQITGEKDKQGGGVEAGRYPAAGHYFDQYGPGTEEFRLSGNMPVEGLSPSFGSTKGIPKKLQGIDTDAMHLNRELRRTNGIVYQVGLSINSQIGGALSRVIGQAQGFEGVLLAILSDLLGFGLSLGLNALTGGLAGDIGAGSVVSGGDSALRGSSINRRITSVGTRRSSGGGSLAGQIAEALSSGAFRVRGTDLVWASEKGSHVLRSSRI